MIKRNKKSTVIIKKNRGSTLLLQQSYFSTNSVITPISNINFHVIFAYSYGILMKESRRGN